MGWNTNDTTRTFLSFNNGKTKDETKDRGGESHWNCS